MRGPDAVTNILKPPPREVQPMENNLINPPPKEINFMNLSSSSSNDARIVWITDSSNEPTTYCDGLDLDLYASSVPDCWMFVARISRKEGYQKTLKNDATKKSTVQVEGSSSVQPNPAGVYLWGVNLMNVSNEDKEKVKEEKSKGRGKTRQKKIITENENVEAISIENSKEKPQENVEKYKGVRQRKWGCDLMNPSNEEKGKVKEEKSEQDEMTCEKEMIVKNNIENTDEISIENSKGKQIKLPQKNVKKYKGVRQRKWVSEVQVPKMRNRIWLGMFDMSEEAALTYDKAVIEMRGPDAVTNILKPPPREVQPMENNLINPLPKEINFMNLSSSSSNDARV
uniref:AP2 domain class transcription factor n=1 Tax=Solanum tuberosum TaxID=4113 RepID=M1DI15_SOLTU